MRHVYADLHCHSWFSDSSESLGLVIAGVLARGAEALSITDHDTLAGQYEALSMGWAHSIQVITGIEISAFDPGRRSKVHILGYFLDPHDEHIEAFCRHVRVRRNESARKALEVIRTLGYPIEWADLLSLAAPGEVVYKQHLFQAMIGTGRIDGDGQDLYNSLFSMGGRAHFPIRYPDARDAVRQICDRGGIAVLAHPGLYGNYPYLRALVDAGLAGIEAYHPAHGAADREACIDLAAEHRLLLTGGSDCHGGYDGRLSGSGECGIGRADYRRLFGEVEYRGPFRNEHAQRSDECGNGGGKKRCFAHIG